jgi:hypothetical protein
LKTLNDLFVTIMSIPHVDVDTKVRAGFLQTQLCGKGRGFDLGSLFGFAR